MSKSTYFRSSIKPLIILTNCSLLQATYLKTSLKNNEKYYKIYIVLKILVLIFVLFFYSRILFVLNIPRPSIIANNVRQLNFCMITMTYLCIFINNVRKNTRYNELIETFENFDKILNLPKIYYNKTVKQIQFFIAYITSTYILIAIEKSSNSFYYSNIFYYPYEFYIVYCVPLFPSSVSMLNFLVFVSMIQVRLGYINEKLKINSENCELNNNLTLKLLRDMCALHMKLNDIALLINDVFGISIVVTVGMYFMQLMIGGYTIVMTINSDMAASDMYRLSAASILYNYPYITLLFWICYCCRCTVRQVI